MLLSKELFARAEQHIPGGVNSPVRAFGGVGGTPLFIKRGEGAYLIDVDDKRYIDYVASWGPLILGHNHPDVVDAVQKAVLNGLSFGAPTEIEIELADKVCQLMPNIEMVRMVNSGTEATMTAIRLARGYTQRDKIIKFQGCYHGHSDSLLVNAGSGALTLGVPSSPGVPKCFAEQTLTADFNSLESVRSLFENHKDQVAAIIVEPVAGNMGCVPPIPGFLEGLRELCDQHNAVLIFDEVMTGFRVALGGAQAHYNIKPDLTTLGKIIGGGMPVGALGGRKEIMQHLSPAGAVYQAGTLAGNPIAMAAGLATLQALEKPGFYQSLTSTTEKLMQALQETAVACDIPLQVNTVGAMFGLFFTENETVTTYQDVMNCNVERFKKFFHGMLQQGIYLAPSAFESGFVSIAHHDEEINLTIQAVETVFKTL